MASFVQLALVVRKCSRWDCTEPCYYSSVNRVWHYVTDITNARRLFHFRGLNAVLALWRVQGRGDLGMFRPALFFLFLFLQPSLTQLSRQQESLHCSPLILCATLPTFRVWDGYYIPEEMAQTLAFLAGMALAIIGALRLGFLVTICLEL